MGIGIGERGARRGLDPQMTQLAFTALQAPFNFAQRVRTTQLTEQHRHELAPTAQPLRASFGPGLLHQSLKIHARNKLGWCRALQSARSGRGDSSSANTSCLVGGVMNAPLLFERPRSLPRFVALANCGPFPDAANYNLCNTPATLRALPATRSRH